ncbi:MAG: Mn-containing catalase [Firmicutes bacterium]|nr:Mn-containing catalase [Bacillota bacterium]
MTKKNEEPNVEKRTKSWCALPDAYPKPSVCQQNLFYATLLLEDYAGNASELTAINQYMHHHFMFDDKYKDLAELEECIGIIEMHHLELLAESILLLGVDPKYRTLTNNSPTFWDASYVFYGTDIYDMLAADIVAEKQAIKQYRKHHFLIEDIHIKGLLERIIKDEEYHLKLFTQAASHYCPELFRKITGSSDQDD